MGEIGTKNRITIGVIINRLDLSYQSSLIDGIKKAAKDKDINVLIFSGMSLKSPWKDERNYNIIYQLINEKRIDGLIITSGILMNYVSENEFFNFIDSFKSIPLISLTYSIPNVHSIVLDNKSSMRLVYDHLINTHNYKKIALITGVMQNPESVERYRAYEEALKENNIEFNEEYVANGDFTVDSGYEAVKELINKRGIMPEAIVAFNDEMAVGALRALQELNIEVGKDIALTGFDDYEILKLCYPSITTVKQPTFEMAFTSVNYLCDLIDWKEVPKNTYFTGSLKLRYSCGCNNFLNDSLSLKLSQDVNMSDFEEGINQLYENISRNKVAINNIIRMNTGIHADHYTDLSNKIEQSLGLLVNDIKNRTIQGDFVRVFSNILNDIIMTKNLDFTWYDSVLIIRKYLLQDVYNSEIMDIAEGIFFVISTLIGNIQLSKSVAGKYKVTYSYSNTRYLMRLFDSAIYMDQLVNILKNDLESFGITQCYLCLYDKPISYNGDGEFIYPKEMSLVFGNDGKKTVYDKKFNTKDILPDEFYYQQRRNELAFMPLFNGTDYFGYVAFADESNDDFIFDVLRELISSTLKNQMIFNQRREAEEQLKDAFYKLGELNKELELLSVKDELTGLYNRRGFFIKGEKFYKEARQRKQNFIMLYCDMDELKSINDTYGHEEGDVAIKNVAHILQSSFKKEDIVARIGGDEFILIIMDVSSENCVEEMTDRISINFKEYSQSAGKPYNLSVSVGAAYFSAESDSNFEQLMKEADSKLYKLKRKKKAEKERMLSKAYEYN